MTAADAEQLAWQIQAARVLGHLLGRAHREGLPVLGWSVSTAGVSLQGHSYATPHSSRRSAVTAWGQALGIPLHERPRGDGAIVIWGTVEHLDTPRGWCTVTLSADIYDETGEDGDHGQQP